MREDEELEVRVVAIGDEEYEIVRGRPLPEAAKRGRTGKSKYPIKDLEVGEAFKLVGVKRATVDTMKNKYGKSLGRKFRIETVAGGFYLHRVE
jgi:hypothetical protein